MTKTQRFIPCGCPASFFTCSSLRRVAVLAGVASMVAASVKKSVVLCATLSIAGFNGSVHCLSDSGPSDSGLNSTEKMVQEGLAYANEIFKNSSFDLALLCKSLEKGPIEIEKGEQLKKIWPGTRNAALKLMDFIDLAELYSAGSNLVGQKPKIEALSDATKFLEHLASENLSVYCGLVEDLFRGWDQAWEATMKGQLKAIHKVGDEEMFQLLDEWRLLSKALERLESLREEVGLWTLKISGKLMSSGADPGVCAELEEIARELGVFREPSDPLFQTMFLQGSQNFPERAMAADLADFGPKNDCSKAAGGSIFKFPAMLFSRKGSGEDGSEGDGEGKNPVREFIERQRSEGKMEGWMVREPQVRELRGELERERGEKEREKGRADREQREKESEKGRADAAERKADSEKGRADGERERADSAERQTQEVREIVERAVMPRWQDALDRSGEGKSAWAELDNCCDSADSLKDKQDSKDKDRDSDDHKDKTIEKLERENTGLKGIVGELSGRDPDSALCERNERLEGELLALREEKSDIEQEAWQKDAETQREIAKLQNKSNDFQDGINRLQEKFGKKP